MTKHFFYSMFITFLLIALAEFVRPGFATNFLNTNILFIILVLAGCLIFLKPRALDK